MKLNRDKLLSDFAVNFNLRHYSKSVESELSTDLTEQKLLVRSVVTRFLADPEQFEGVGKMGAAAGAAAGARAAAAAAEARGQRRETRQRV